MRMIEGWRIISAVVSLTGAIAQAFPLQENTPVIPVQAGIQANKLWVDRDNLFRRSSGICQTHQSKLHPKPTHQPDR